MGQGWAQIVFCAVVLVSLSYPLGSWMAQELQTRERGDVLERGFVRLLGPDAAGDQDWKGYGKSVVAFTVVFSAFLYALLRLQGHLFLKPYHLPGCALDGGVEHDRQLRHEHELQVGRR